jgi:hypothetical protein
VAIPPCGTCEYVVTVPGPRDDGAPWSVRLCTPIALTGDDLMDARLVGHAPTLEITDAGMATVVAQLPLTGVVAPKVRRSRLTLAAPLRQHAMAASATFHVDRALTEALVPGDLLYIARTACGGLGLSIVRNGQLIAAAGAVSAVFLGDGVRVGRPADAIARAADVLRAIDPEFRFPEWPVEINVGAHTRLLYGGRPRLDGYEVFVLHGFFPGIPGTDECVAISLAGTCPDVAAIASAQLLDGPDSLMMKRWAARSQPHQDGQLWRFPF